MTYAQLHALIAGEAALTGDTKTQPALPAMSDADDLAGWTGDARGLQV